jgi:ABC-type glutathione transport system ATPase component
MADGLYAEGRVNFLDVLDVRRSLYQSDDQLAVSDQAVSLDLIALYKALGGGWETLTPGRQRRFQPPQRHDAARFLSRIVLLDGVCKSFRRETGESVLALDNISFSVGHGELAALIGPDGAGKTTLIRLLAGLMKSDSGIVSVLGIDAAKDPQAIQSRISYMPQKFGLYDDLTVRENLDLYADLHGVTAEERRTQYTRLMEMTGLDPFQKRLAGQLSGGMKQKLGLACTLVRIP